MLERTITGCRGLDMLNKNIAGVFLSVLVIFIACVSPTAAELLGPGCREAAPVGAATDPGGRAYTV